MRFPTIYIDKNLKISETCWNSRGTIFYATSNSEQHLGPCNHNSYLFYFKINDFSQKNQIEKNYIEINVSIFLISLVLDVQMLIRKTLI